MIMDNFIDHPLFGGFSGDDLIHITSLCREKILGEGASVFLESMPGEAFYFIQSGSV